SELKPLGLTPPADPSGTLTTNPSSVSWVSGYKYILEWSGGEMLTGTGNITITVSAAVKDLAGNALGSKLQTPNKSQVPSSKPRPALRAWNLELRASLVLGVWSFDTRSLIAGALPDN